MTDLICEVLYYSTITTLAHTGDPRTTGDAWESHPGSMGSPSLKHVPGWTNHVSNSFVSVDCAHNLSGLVNRDILPYLRGQNGLGDEGHADLMLYLGRSILRPVTYTRIRDLNQAGGKM